MSHIQSAHQPGAYAEACFDGVCQSLYPRFASTQFGSVRLYCIRLVFEDNTSFTHRDTRENNGDCQVVKRSDMVGGDDAACVVPVFPILFSHHQAHNRVQNAQHKTRRNNSIFQLTVYAFPHFYLHFLTNSTYPDTDC